MANLSRVHKSASKWTSADLSAYNMVVEDESAEQFFGGSPLPDWTGPADFLTIEDLEFCGWNPAIRLIASLRRVALHDGTSDGAMSDFVYAVLDATGYSSMRTIVNSRRNISLVVCGKTAQTKTVVTVDNWFNDHHLLIVQEDRSNYSRSTSDAEAHLIAGMIAAFQENRDRENESVLDQSWIVGIKMVGSFPTFYKVNVTADLDDAIRHGAYPATTTTVYRHTPLVPGDVVDGMKPTENRKALLPCFEALKGVMFGLLDEPV